MPSETGETPPAENDTPTPDPEEAAPAEETETPEATSPVSDEDATLEPTDSEAPDNLTPEPQNEGEGDEEALGETAEEVPGETTDPVDNSDVNEEPALGEDASPSAPSEALSESAEPAQEEAIPAQEAEEIEDDPTQLTTPVMQQPDSDNPYIRFDALDDRTNRIEFTIGDENVTLTKKQLQNGTTVWASDNTDLFPISGDGAQPIIVLNRQVQEAISGQTITAIAHADSRISEAASLTLEPAPTATLNLRPDTDKVTLTVAPGKTVSGNARDIILTPDKTILLHFQNSLLSAVTHTLAGQSASVTVTSDTKTIQEARDEFILPDKPGYTSPHNGDYSSPCKVNWYVETVMNTSIENHPNNGYIYKVRGTGDNLLLFFRGTPQEGISATDTSFWMGATFTADKPCPLPVDTKTPAPEIAFTDTGVILSPAKPPKDDDPKPEPEDPSPTPTPTPRPPVVTPEEPDQPEQPEPPLVTPEVPEKPETPKEPETPDIPDVTPETPEDPETPTAPETPKDPEAPTDPEKPAPSKTTKTQPTATKEIPKTGDPGTAGALWMSLLGALGALGINRRRK